MCPCCNRSLNKILLSLRGSWLSRLLCVVVIFFSARILFASSMMNQAIADAKFLRAQLDALAGQSIREFIESKEFVIAPVHRACLFSDEEHEGELSLLLTNLTHTQRLDKREA